MPSTGEGEHIVVAQNLLARIESAILFPLMALMMALALLVFIWGAYEYVLHADSDEGRSKGHAHMLTGIIGLLVMLSAYAILSIATGTFGIDMP